MFTKRNFYKFSFLIIFTRILDGITTYLSSPDLKFEQNIIIKYFDLGWGEILGLGLVYTSSMVLLLVYGYKNHEVFRINSSDLKTYISLFFFKKKLSFFLMITSLPKKKSSIVFFSLFFPISLIYYSYFLIINNTFMYLIDLSDFFYKIFVKIHYVLNPLNIIIIIFVSIYTFYKILYQGYKNSSI